MSTKDQPASFLLGTRAAPRTMEIIIDPAARQLAGLLMLDDQRSTAATTIAARVIPTSRPGLLADS
jgi:hypothetical protein